jgi:formylglycine-generating enzyme required for sulfatase activity
MKATADARPIHRVYVDGFYMDKTDVTNAQFARFGTVALLLGWALARLIP